MPIRGAMTAEDFAKEVAEAFEELNACKTKEDVQAFWRKRYGRMGHKALGRLIVGMSAEAVIAKRIKGMATRE